MRWISLVEGVEDEIELSPQKYHQKTKSKNMRMKRKLLQHQEFL